MMRVFVSDIPEEGICVEFKGEDYGWVGLKGVPVSVYPYGRLIIQKSGLTVFIEGIIHSELVLPCSRCLENFKFPLCVPVRYTLRPKSSTVEKEKELTPEDLEYGYYEDDVLEMEALIEEPVLLSIPMKPLCREDCLGICPVCGETRNIYQCHCQAKAHNSPFSVLKEYFKDNQ